MNKDKTLKVLQRTILDLKEGLDVYIDVDDEKGVHYTKGRIDGLLQLVGLIHAGKLDD